MQDLLRETKRNIVRIRDYIECDVLPKNKYKLTTFREEPGLIIDLLNDIDESIL